MGKQLQFLAILLLIPAMLMAESLKFVIIYPVLHPFFSSTSMGARAEAAKNSDIELLITGPATQSAKDQIKLIDWYIGQGINAIAIGPTDDTLGPIIDSAVKSGIPVICIDTDAQDSSRLSFIGTDNYAAGFEMGKQVAHFLDGKGKILITVSSLRTRNMIQRISGFSEAIGQHDALSIVAIEEGMANSEIIFSKVETHIKRQSFNAIVTMDAESGPVVVQMWKAWGLNSPVFCFDDRQLVIEGLQDGIVKVAIFQNQYAWGTEAIKAMLTLSRGQPVQEYIDTGIRIVTPETLSDELE
jgi:ribose transport system substrate-binding protein